MIELTHWFIFPIAVVVATIAMSTFASGALFFTPIFMFLGIDPVTSIGIALIIKSFSYASGLFFHSRKKYINYKIGWISLTVSIPAALIGVYLAGIIDPSYLKIIFGLGLLFIGYEMYKTVSTKTVDSVTKFEKIRYKSSFKETFMTFAAIGGLLLGMISGGLGELLGYNLIKKYKVHYKVAVSTTIFTVTFTTIAASIGYFYEFFTTYALDVMDQVVNLITFAVPGVFVGSFIGTHITYKLKQSTLMKFLSGVLVVPGILSLTTIW